MQKSIFRAAIEALELAERRAALLEQHTGAGRHRLQRAFHVRFCPAITKVIAIRY
jgi:hypothetical protein